MDRPPASSSHLPPGPAQRGATIGPYRVVQTLGHGAMGSVYEVERGGGRYALKVIRAHLIGDAEELARFQSEAALIARLDHPNVVRLRDAVLRGQHPYQVYDLFPGGTLGALLKREGQLPLDEALSITRKLGEGLAHAHARGVLHRDLKPENVLLSGQGEPALADFGLARPDLARSRELTATGETIGTPVYMAPEQATDSKRIDVRADLYGLAAICYALLTGHPPVVGANTVLEAFDKVLNDPPPPIGRKDVPKAVEVVILRGLAKSAEDRPATVEAFLSELEAALAPQASAGRPLLVLGVALLALVLGLALGAGGVSSLRPSPTPDPGLQAEVSRLERELEVLRARPTPTPTSTPEAASAPARESLPEPGGWLTVSSYGYSVSLLIGWETGTGEVRGRVLRVRYQEAASIWDSADAEEGALEWAKPLLGHVYLRRQGSEDFVVDEVTLTAKIAKNFLGLLRGKKGARLLRYVGVGAGRQEPVRSVNTRAGLQVFVAWEPLAWVGPLSRLRKAGRGLKWQAAAQLLSPRRPDRLVERLLFNEPTWQIAMERERLFPTEAIDMTRPVAIQLPRPGPPEVDLRARNGRPIEALQLGAPTTLRATPHGLAVGAVSLSAWVIVTGQTTSPPDQITWAKVAWQGVESYVRVDTANIFGKKRLGKGSWANTGAAALNLRDAPPTLKAGETVMGDVVATLPPWTPVLMGPGTPDPRNEQPERWVQVFHGSRLLWAARYVNAGGAALNTTYDEDAKKHRVILLHEH